MARGIEGVVDREIGGDLVFEIDGVFAFCFPFEDGVGTRLPAIGVIALGALVGVVLLDKWSVDGFSLDGVLGPLGNGGAALDAAVPTF